MSQEQFYQTVQMEQEWKEHTMKSWVEQYLDEQADVEYCPYCMNERGNKMSCCHEVHFIKFSELELHEQMEIAHQEWEAHHVN